MRKRLANLERMQALRIEMVDKRKAALDALVARKQREIDNLRATAEPVMLKVAT